MKTLKLPRLALVATIALCSAAVATAAHSQHEPPPRARVRRSQPRRWRAPPSAAPADSPRPLARPLPPGPALPGWRTARPRKRAVARCHAASSQRTGGGAIPRRLLLMNPPPQPDHDPALRALLQAVHSTHPAPSLPPRFQEGVWLRIDRDERRSPTVAPAWWEQLLPSLFRPAYAAAGLATVMIAGIWLGLRDANTRRDQSERTRYVAAVSPFHRTAP